MKRQLGHEQDYDELISHVESIHLLPMKNFLKEYLSPLKWKMWCLIIVMILVLIIMRQQMKLIKIDRNC